MLYWVLRISKLLAMAPSKTNNINFPHYAQAYLMIGFYLISVSASIFVRFPHYLTLRPINLLVQIILDGILLILNIYTISTTLTKKSQWCQLLVNLKVGKNYNLNVVSFIIANIFFHSIHLYSTFVFSEIIGVEYLEQYGIEYLQLYSQFIVYFLMYTILKILLLRYTQLKKSLAEERRPTLSLEVIQDQILILKETVDAFNDIFGWPFLLLISFTSFQIMVYLQGIFVGSRKSFQTIISNINIISWHSVRIL